METNSLNIFLCGFNLFLLRWELLVNGFPVSPDQLATCPACKVSDLLPPELQTKHSRLHTLITEASRKINKGGKISEADLSETEKLLKDLMHEGSAIPFHLHTTEDLVNKTAELRDIIRLKGKQVDEIQQRFTFLLNATQEAVWDWDIKNNILWWNDGYYKLFGYNRESFPATPETWKNSVHPEDVTEITAKIQNAVVSKIERFENEYRFLKADGSYAFVHDRAHLVFSEEGEVLRMIGSMTDISRKKEDERRIRENEKRLEAVFNSVFDGISVFDDSGQVIMVNQAQATINGFETPEEMMRDLEYFAKVYELKHPDGRTCPLEEWPISRVYRGEIFSNYILKGRRTDTGREWVFSFSGYPVTDDGKITLAIVVTKDITESALASEEIERQNHLMQLITSNATTGLLIMDEHQKCTFMNEAAEKITGYTFEEILSFDKPLHDIIHHTKPDGSHYPMSECPIDRALPTENNTSGTDLFVRADGTFYDVAFNASPIIEKGKPIGTVIEIRDITEEKRIQSDLKEREEQFRILANNMQSLAWMAQPDGYIFWYNKQWFDYTGTTLEEMKGWGWQKVHHPDHRKRVLDFVSAAWTKEEPFELIFPLRSASGEYRRFLTRAYPVKDESGKLLRWVGTNTDVEEQQSFTERLEQEVKDRTKQLSETNVNLSQFAHVTSHDLKEPARKIKMFTLMLRDALGDKTDEGISLYIERLTKSADRMNMMIDGILKYSSAEANSTDFKKVDLNRILNSIVTDLELLIKEKNAVVVLPGNFPEIEGLEIPLNQLFYNLLNNALKFCDSDPRITISYTLIRDAKGERIRILVEDNGIGFDAKYAENIFQAFTRLNSKDVYEGTGLGLALCKKVVDKHHGTIQAFSEPGKGSKFVVELPVKNVF